MNIGAKMALILVALLALAAALVLGAGACGSACKQGGGTCTLNEQCCSHVCDREALGTCGCAPSGGSCETNDDCCGGRQCSNGRCGGCGEELARCSGNADCCTGFTCQQGMCLPR